MASTPIAHRSVQNIKTGAGAGAGFDRGGPHTPPGGGGGAGSGAGAGAGSPHTPVRGVSSAFASPSSLRAEEDTVVIELGSRAVRVGFGGDAAPKALVRFGPDEARRVGDFRRWTPGQEDEWRRREGGGGGGGGSGARGRRWGEDHELYRVDLRGLDMGLVSDKLERGLRDAFTKHLLIDSRPRRTVLVLPPGMPLPLLSTILDTLFTRFQTPYVSLLSSPVMCAAAAGVRAALVVDMGWAETVVTSVYELREVATTRTVRAGRMLTEVTHRLLAQAVAAADATQEEKELSGGFAFDYHDGSDGDGDGRVVSFAECEDVVARMLWCRPSADAAGPRPAADGGRRGAGLAAAARGPAAAPSSGGNSGSGLPTVTEQDESSPEEFAPPETTVTETPPPPPQSTLTATTPPTTAIIRLTSPSPPKTVELPFYQLSEPAEHTFFESQLSEASFDDHELPLHLLVYRHLLDLPLDARGMCMSRILFTGGCASVLGLRARVFDEVAGLVRERGWDPVRGKGVEQLRANPKLRGRKGRSGGGGGAVAASSSNGSLAHTTTPSSPSSPGDPKHPDANGNGSSSNDNNHNSNEQDGIWHDAANAKPEACPVDEQLRRQSSHFAGSNRNHGASPVRGRLRCLETLGPWRGASLAAQLRVPAVATVDRELWASQDGVRGASRPQDVDVRATATAAQRQSIGGVGGALRIGGPGGPGGGGGGGGGAAAAGGYGTGATSWTLGAWGSL